MPRLKRKWGQMRVGENLNEPPPHARGLTHLRAASNRFAALACFALAVSFVLVARAQENEPPSVATAPAAAAPPENTQSTDAGPNDELIRRGTGEFVAPAPSETPAAAAGAPGAPLDIDFERAPVGLAVQSLLADAAGANVIIDPRVTGEVTLHSRGRVSLQEIPALLRATVASIGLELVEQGPNTFLLRPRATDPNAQGAPTIYRPGAQSLSGLVIFGLRYVSAQEMTRLLQPFARNGVTVSPEPTREMLILSGSPAQVESLVRTIELLDVDWLAGMSYGLVPLEYSDPATLIEELRTLFGGAQGPIGSMVEFVPMRARRAVLILAKRPERLDEARNWIMQLDRPNRTGVGGIRFIQLENADAAQVAETITGLFEGQQGAAQRITADAGRNALLVQADPATFEDIRNLVVQLDAPVDQVVIETTIAEVTLNNDFRFGVQWSFDTRDGGRAILSDADNGGVGPRFPGFSYGYEGNYVHATLNAISSRTQVEVISSPVIVTLDNQEATLQVGDEVPVITQSASGVASADATIISTVQYRETGILLRVTPRIGSGGLVTMEVAQEASEVSATTTSGIDSPTIQQRKFQSTVAVEDGQTVALGGLIRASRTRNRAGVPFLSAVPILGAAFRNSDNTVRRTELIVFLTPRIIRNTQDAAAATQDLEDRLRRLRNSSFINSYAPSH